MEPLSRAAQPLPPNPKKKEEKKRSNNQITSSEFSIRPH